jgi:hypothetical protein
VRSGETHTRGFALSFQVDPVTGLLFTEQVILEVPGWASIDDAMIERLDSEARSGVVMQKTMGAALTHFDVLGQRMIVAERATTQCINATARRLGNGALRMNPLVR